MKNKHFSYNKNSDRTEILIMRVKRFILLILTIIISWTSQSFGYNSLEELFLRHQRRAQHPYEESMFDQQHYQRQEGPVYVIDEMMRAYNPRDYLPVTFNAIYQSPDNYLNQAIVLPAHFVKMVHPLNADFAYDQYYCILTADENGNIYGIGIYLPRHRKYHPFLDRLQKGNPFKIYGTLIARPNGYAIMLDAIQLLDQQFIYRGINENNIIPMPSPQMESYQYSPYYYYREYADPHYAESGWGMTEDQPLPLRYFATLLPHYANQVVYITANYKETQTTFDPHYPDTQYYNIVLTDNNGEGYNIRFIAPKNDVSNRIMGRIEPNDTLLLQGHISRADNQWIFYISDMKALLVQGIYFPLDE